MSNPNYFLNHFRIRRIKDGFSGGGTGKVCADLERRSYVPIILLLYVGIIFGFGSCTAISSIILVVIRVVNRCVFSGF